MRGGCAPARRSRAIMARPPLIRPYGQPSPHGGRLTTTRKEAHAHAASTLRPCAAASALRGLCDSGGAVYPLPRLAAATGIERRGGRAVSLRGRGFPARWRCGCTAGAGRRVGRRACAIPSRQGGRCLEKSGLRPRFHAVFRRCCVYLAAVLCTAADVYPVG